MYALNPDGTEKWVLSSVNGDYFDSSPAIDSEGYVYAVSYHGDIYKIIGPNTYDIELTAGGEADGWNFVSTKLVPENTSLTSILDDPAYGINGSYDKVMMNVREDNKIVYTQDFEGGTLPPGWVSEQWEITHQTYGNMEPAYDGTYMAGIEYYQNNDEWLISEAIDLSGTSELELRFYDSYEFGEYAANPNYIKVSTTDQAPSSFTDTVKTFSTSYIQGRSDNVWALQTVDLSAYAGESTVYIAWQYLGDDGENWFIDDIIVEQVNYDYPGEWSSYVPGRADHFNNIDRLSNVNGFWIHMTTNDTLTIVGLEPTSTDIDLAPGWNMVGYPSNTDRSASDTLPGEVTKMGVFNASREYNLEYIYDLSTYTMTAGEGYWMYNDADYVVTWTVEY